MNIVEKKGSAATRILNVGLVAELLLSYASIIGSRVKLLFERIIFVLLTSISLVKIIYCGLEVNA